MNNKDLIPHLFRTEYSKIAAVLCTFLGVDHMEAAEDIASETFTLALDTWPYKGIPRNPTAWLYSVAKNKARNQIRHNKIFKEKISNELKRSPDEEAPVEIDLSEENITDSKLQMLFAICHPSISVESQIGLALRILCGFGIDEIADAFLSNRETISKRLMRARETLRTEKVQIVPITDSEIDLRLDTVLKTLYLLFNEGYYSESHDALMREDLCLEAIRLTQMLIENTKTDLPAASALLSLMCFHASRFAARKNGSGEIILYQDQDESLWDRRLIGMGAYYLHLASQGENLSKYHLEAGIAYWHTVKKDSPKKWESVLKLYNRLLQVEYSSVAALNRTFAIAKANAHLPDNQGKKLAIAEAEKLDLGNNHYYFTLLGILYKNIDQEKSKINFLKALPLAKSHTDKKTIMRYLDMFDKK